MTSDRDQDGFTLIELLVSLAILAITLAVLFSAISNSLDSVRRSRNEALASSLAQSLLVRADTDGQLAPGETGGIYSNGFHWRVTVRPYGNNGDTLAWRASAFVLRAAVSWRDGEQQRSRELATLRIVPQPI